ncbi:MAG: DUF433 domain-containing protein [Candidatus Freyarchaeota archaeon]
MNTDRRSRIVIDPKILAGKPIIKGTRIFSRIRLRASRQRLDR